jgi:DNA-binding FrmR family transcriptional regulator
MHHHSKKKFLHALHRLQGTLIGIEKMFHENRPLPDISLQFLASLAAHKTLCDKKFLTLFREELFFEITLLEQTHSQNANILKTLAEIKKQLHTATCKQLWQFSNQLAKIQ